MDRNSIQYRCVRKFVSNFAVCKVDVQAMLDKFKNVMADAPVDKTIAGKIFVAVFVGIAAGSFWYFYVL